MRHANDPTLRRVLSHLVDTETQLADAAKARDEAAKAFWRVQTKAIDARRHAAALLADENGVVTHDGHTFERMGDQAVSVKPIARELPIEQASLLPESGRAA